MPDSTTVAPGAVEEMHCVLCASAGRRDLVQPQLGAFVGIEPEPDSVAHYESDGFHFGPANLGNHLKTGHT